VTEHELIQPINTTQTDGWLWPSKLSNRQFQASPKLLPFRYSLSRVSWYTFHVAIRALLRHRQAPAGLGLKVGCDMVRIGWHAEDPSRAIEGSGKPLSQGPISQPHSECAEIETPKASASASKDETWGSRRVSPHHPTRSLGSVASSPAAENGFYAYMRSERSHLEHLFQYLWALAVFGGPPKRRGARENSPLCDPIFQDRFYLGPFLPEPSLPTPHFRFRPKVKLPLSVDL